MNQEQLTQSIKELMTSGESDKAIIDALLELDRDARDLGCDFTKESLKEAKEFSKKIYKAISKIDKKVGNLLIYTIDN